MDTLDATTFRFNPGLDLVLFDRLEPSLQARLADLGRDASFYGILVPAGGAGRASDAATVRPVDRESALLLLTLRTPGPIPRYARRLLGPDAARTIAGLVLDGVLDIERGGTFCSGPAAADAVAALDGALALDGARPRGATARLSYQALRHGAMLQVDDVADLARRLYGYNRLPLDPSPPDGRTSVDEDPLGLAARPLAAALDRGWRCTASGADGGWMSWAPRAGHEPGADIRGTVKLYVSPALPAVRGAFAATVAAAGMHRALAFKVGTGRHGLLRPDKLVVYFSRREQLYAAAEALTGALAGAPAQGVPFTAAVSDDGMLSWGADPPAHAGLVGAIGTESWRSWLTTQLAAALIAGRRRADAPSAATDPMDASTDAATGVADAVGFALRRAAALGIDVATWAPPDTLWGAADS
jgi:hypothetical protein